MFFGGRAYLGVQIRNTALGIRTVKIIRNNGYRAHVGKMGLILADSNVDAGCKRYDIFH